MIRLFLPFWALFFPLYLGAQRPASAMDGYYPLLRKAFDEKNAFETVAFVEKRWRLAGNAGFNESIFYVENILKKAGFKKEVTGELDGPLTYRIESRKMIDPTWEPVAATLSIEGVPGPLLDFATNRNILAIYSASTPEGGETGDVVNVGKGTLKEFEGKDLRGKIVFGEGSPGQLYRQAVKAGALGVLAYSMPGYTRPDQFIHSVQFEHIPYLDPANQKWAILLSYAAREKLLTAMAKGRVTVRVKVASKIYRSDELTLVANARGSVKPAERFVLSAHVQEPGANDNASGVGTLAEMARITAQLIQKKKFVPHRTLTFLWGDEIVSTDRYINEEPERAKGIMWGLSLDMVGEDIAKTGGSFLIEKMPDPSAVWTRGKDRHTEWGGSALRESDLFPHYFNDFLLNRCRQQGRENGWVVNTNPFEGGSDHTPFLEAKIAAVLLWHFTDVFYHTNADRLEMVSAVEMKNVGVSSLAAAFTLLSADEGTVEVLIEELTTSALERLETEYELGRKAMLSNAFLPHEQHILEVWATWYTGALEKMNEINVQGSTKRIAARIARGHERILSRKDELLKMLAGKN